MCRRYVVLASVLWGAHFCCTLLSMFGPVCVTVEDRRNNIRVVVVFDGCPMDSVFDWLWAKHGYRGCG